MVLATLIANHRRKFNKTYFNQLADHRVETTRYWAILLRLAVLLHRSRSPDRIPRLKFKVSVNSLRISFPAGWLDNHQLTNADLEQEAEYLSAIDFELNFS